MEVNGEAKVVAPFMYKVIIMLATLDRNATVTAMGANLHELTQYAIKENGNIENIHTYLNQNYAQLKAQWTMSTPSFLMLTFKVF